MKADFSNNISALGGKVAQWLALVPHNQKVEPFCVLSLCVRGLEALEE